MCVRLKNWDKGEVHRASTITGFSTKSTSTSFHRKVTYSQHDINEQLS